MKNLIFKTIIIFILCMVLIQLSIFAGYNLTIETQTNCTTYAVGGTVITTVDWGQEMQATGFVLRFNSTKLSFMEASVNDNYYSISEPTKYETSEDTYRDISVQWADGNSKTNMTFEFRTLESGNADISVINANAFANENMQIPEQIDYRTKGTKTIKISTIGDINLDGVVNSRDVTRLNQYVEGLIELNEEALINADVCADEEINKLDVDILRKYVDGWAISFPFIYGDADCNGKVTINDATVLQQYNLPEGNFELSREGLNRADVNLDGNVDEFDRIIIQRYLENMDNYKKLPVKIVKNSNIKSSVINDEMIITGFNSSNLKVSNIKQQFNNNLGIDIYNANNEKLDDNKLLATGNEIIIDEKTTDEVEKYLAGTIEEYTAVIYGDTTGDGKINAIDALALIKDVNNKIPFKSEVYRQAGRIVCSNNQIPTAVDALAIIKAANGKYEINQNK